MADNSRRLERERVLGLLYEAQMKNATIGDVLAELPVVPESFVVDTVQGVSSDPQALDALIEKHSTHWKLDRMATIDRTILRIGVWELQARPHLSVAVVISEAVELAKRFSTEESGRFVNGILASVADEVRV